MLSRGAQRILKQMHDAHLRDDFENAELTCEGRACWVDATRTSRAVVRELLLHCLLNLSSLPGDLERYCINEDGRKCALDPAHRPQGLLTLHRALLAVQAPARKGRAPKTPAARARKT
jgi:hypothetical protein